MSSFLEITTLICFVFRNLIMQKLCQHGHSSRCRSYCAKKSRYCILRCTLQQSRATTCLSAGLRGRCLTGCAKDQLSEISMQRTTEALYQLCQSCSISMKHSQKCAKLFQTVSFSPLPFPASAMRKARNLPFLAHFSL